MIPYNDSLAESLFLKRESHHRQLVKKCLLLLANLTNSRSKELKKRAELHDQSKYKKIEKKGYKILSWFYWHKKTLGDFPSLSQEQSRAIELAKQHHYQNNRHHPEFFQDVCLMTKCDLEEMVCDWMAIALENTGSPRRREES